RVSASVAAFARMRVFSRLLRFCTRILGNAATGENHGDAIVFLFVWFFSMPLRLWSSPFSSGRLGSLARPGADRRFPRARFARPLVSQPQDREQQPHLET